MTTEVKVPLLPESISDATVSTWHKKVGDKVSRDENIVDLETDKVMLEVPAPMDGIIKEILKDTGSTVHAQEVIAIIEGADVKQADAKETTSTHADIEKTPAKQASANAKQSAPAIKQVPDAEPSANKPPLSPSVRRMATEHNVDVAAVTGTGKGGRITRENVMSAVHKKVEHPAQPHAKTDAKEPHAASSADKPTEAQAPAPTPTPSSQPTPVNISEANTTMTGSRSEKRVPMTRMRARIAERLLEVTQSTAMLTTFNEVNMAAVMEIRHRYRERFEKKYQLRLGFMSFFVKACVEALKRFPVVNASLDGNDIVYHGYYDIGVAVSTERGLVVPVLRDADKLNMAHIEGKIIESAEKARSGKLTLEEMQGGTFSITNGGVFGSLMATPLLNAPQCAILGMHKIEDRAVVENGQIVIRPMMYLALSYDHRLIDGKESVSFLVAIKELLEDPTRLLLEI